MSPHVRRKVESFARVRKDFERDYQDGLVSEEVYQKYTSRLDEMYKLLVFHHHENLSLQQQLEATRVAARDRLRVQRELARLDKATQLYHKQEFEDNILPRFIRDVARDKRDWHDRRSDLAALWILDLNRFKLVNDDPELGHDVGDEVITVLANLLKTQIRHVVPRFMQQDKPDVPVDKLMDWEDPRASGFPARIGGDEFAVLQTNIRHYTDAHNPADRVKTMFLTHPWEQINQALPKYNPSVSIGVVVLRLNELRGNQTMVRHAVTHAKEIAKEWQRLAYEDMYFVKNERLSQVKTREFGYSGGRFIEHDLKGGHVIGTRLSDSA